MIARWLLVNVPNSTFVTMFQELGYSLKKQRDEAEGDNELDDKEKKYFREHSFFVNLLESVKVDDIRTMKEHYKYLALSLLTYQPPLRTSFYTSAMFATKSKDMASDKNYIWLVTQGRRRCYFIVNQDKASNYKEYAKNKNLSEIEIQDKKLVDIIYDSFEKYPRSYLFQTGSNPISQKTFLSFLRDITGLTGLTVDIMRSSYVTFFYDENKTFKKREDLSKQMRHSHYTASKNYLKVFPKPAFEEKDLEIEHLRKENDLLQQKILDLEEKVRSYEPDDRLFRKRRQDVLYTLNKKQGNPKEDTLQKYNIKLDESSNKYV